MPPGLDYELLLEQDFIHLIIFEIDSTEIIIARLKVDTTYVVAICDNVLLFFHVENYRFDQYFHGTSPFIANTMRVLSAASTLWALEALFVNNLMFPLEEFLRHVEHLVFKVG